MRLIASGDGEGPPGCENALAALLDVPAVRKQLGPVHSPPRDRRDRYDPTPPLHRQFDQLVDYTQDLVQLSPKRREEFWAKAENSAKTFAAQPRLGHATLSRDAKAETLVQ